MQDKFLELWREYCGDIDTDTFDRVMVFFEILIKTNSEVNFFSRKITREVLYMDHILDCALALNHFGDAKNILDFGTGGGLPGMILAICLPQKKIFLLDKSNKKVHYLKKMIKHCNVKNVYVGTELEDSDLKKIDCVTSRAVGSLEKTSSKVIDLGVDNAKMIFYKARKEKIEEECQLLSKPFEMEIVPLKNPENKERHLVILSKK
jgi:16S rRNA (guanine527-N7)-methyltransferase